MNNPLMIASLQRNSVGKLVSHTLYPNPAPVSINLFIIIDHYHLGIILIQGNLAVAT